MPVHKTTDHGKTAYQYGKHGKKYTGPSALEKARKQAIAIAMDEMRRGKKPEWPKKGK